LVALRQVIGDITKNMEEKEKKKKAANLTPIKIEDDVV
jgi:hypothetical protein